MKRMIRSSKILDEASEYVPDYFNKESTDDVLSKLKEALKEKLSKRYKKLKVQFANIYFKGPEVQSDVIIYNGQEEKTRSQFTFTQYSDYWDISDYQQHVDTVIQKFVESM